MNIQEAKDSIASAVRAYMSRDPAGRPSVPLRSQRPILVLGAPGLGKTAIMSQIASEMGVGFVSYTMTHHTRQSAIGLPMIEKAVYGGEEAEITRYTMSEIVSSVYDAIEQQGHRNGILFIDEVNCVSETLAPAMLDLLQNKKFGPHRIPDGWVLVAAGNPPEYNASAREMDIATLDRLRVIEVEPDTDVWLNYARGAGLQGSIVYYLQVKPQNLLRIERTPSGPVFVTPRGWEDLSLMMDSYGSMGLEADRTLISQYIREPSVAEEFFRYHGFYVKYSQDHDIESILDGRSADTDAIVHADAEEKLSIISMMAGALASDAEKVLGLEMLLDAMKEKDPKKALTAISDSDPLRRTSAGHALVRLSSPDADGATVEEELEQARTRFGSRMENAMSFMVSAFANGQETSSLLSALLGSYSVVMASEPDGPLYRMNDELFSDGKDRRIEEMLGGGAI